MYMLFTLKFPDNKEQALHFGRSGYRESFVVTTYLLQSEPKFKEQNTLHQNKEQNAPYKFFQNKEQNTTHQKQRANAPYQNKSNCSPSRISSKTRIKRSRLESVCSSNGAPLYNTIQYNNIAQTDSNQENKNLIKERKTMSVKVLK